jgi:hypothetical protein
MINFIRASEDEKYRWKPKEILKINTLEGFLLQDVPHAKYEWEVTIPFNEHKHGSKATFSCTKFYKWAFNKWDPSTEYNQCRLEKIDTDRFDGKIDIHFYPKESPMKIHVDGFYVEDFKPSITGAAVLHFLKNIVRRWPGSVVYLEDDSNVKRLALLTTGKSYYEYNVFQYKDPDFKKMAALEEIRKQSEILQDREIDGLKFKECLKKNLQQEVPFIRNGLFRFDENFKDALLDLVEPQIGKTHKVKEFWVIYREVVKNFSIYELQKKHEFDLKIMRSA